MKFNPSSSMQTQLEVTLCLCISLFLLLVLIIKARGHRTEVQKAVHTDTESAGGCIEKLPALLL